jgi:hypothetical protein
MSVFLTPDRKPFWGGTYFPPEDASGRPGFPTVLNSISEHYHTRPEQVQRATEQLVQVLEQVAEPAGVSSRIVIDDAFISQIIERSTSDYEPMYGGFGNAPKFPRETLLELLLTYTANPRSGKGEDIRKMVLHALDAMANGGIRDHLGGGFHRYSTDAQWLVPHFEIMLYDNAMLGWCYSEAFRQTSNTRYANVARGIFDFVLRELTSASGAFYTAFDAEVDAQEGLSYLWTPDEIEQVLGPDDAREFNRVYGVDRGPNFADPHHGTGRPDKNILYLPSGPDHEADSRIAAMRQKLYAVRCQRKQPLLDTKILTSWNALMIRAMAFAAKTLNEPRYLAAAIRAADFLLSHHRKSDGGVYRTSRPDNQPPSPAKLDGTLEDYAYLAQALLALHDASADPRWRDAAEQIDRQMNARFLDRDRGGYYFTDRSALDLIIRQKTATDSPLPSGNAIAVNVMMSLGQDAIARDTLAVFAEQLSAHGEGMGAMVLAAMKYVDRHGALTVEPAPTAMQRPVTPQDLALSVVSVQARWEDARRLTLLLAIEPPYHINTNHAAKDLVATDLRVTSVSSVESVEYPAGESRTLGFADSPITIFSGEIQILVRFAQDVGEDVEMILHYQACDDTACQAPVSKRLRVPAP